MRCRAIKSDGEQCRCDFGVDEESGLCWHHDPKRADAVTADLIRTGTRRPIQTLAMSSSLTGIWVFANLSRSFDPDRKLSAVRIVRQGIDVGYYSTAYDTDLFRQEMNQSSGERKEALAAYLDDLTPRFYRDPRRMDPHVVDFNRMTCAQCHQTAARDGVHMTINDRLDRRITSPIRASEYIYREIDRQLQLSPDHWKAGNDATALVNEKEPAD